MSAPRPCSSATRARAMASANPNTSSIGSTARSRGTRNTFRNLCLRGRKGRWGRSGRTRPLRPLTPALPAYPAVPALELFDRVALRAQLGEQAVRSDEVCRADDDQRVTGAGKEL